MATDDNTSKSTSSAEAYLPQPRKRAETLEGSLEEYLEDIQQTLKLKELFVLAAIDQDLHSAYYRKWVRDSNALFRVATRLKQRQKKLFAKK